jgi:hypothetical protein
MITKKKNIFLKASVISSYPISSYSYKLKHQQHIINSSRNSSSSKNHLSDSIGAAGTTVAQLEVTEKVASDYPSDGLSRLTVILSRSEIITTRMEVYQLRKFANFMGKKRVRKHVTMIWMLTIPEQLWR